MFDIFRKRAEQPNEAAATPDSPASSQTDYAERKRIALAEAAALTNDEAAAIEFILKCDFADARLQAAQLVHSRSAADQVLQAMRNTDRRVAKLMQTTLDTLDTQQSVSRQAERCIAAARALLSEAHLSPNQVVDLDKEWQAIKNPPKSEQEVFETARDGLRKRLEAQAALQRKALDVLAELRGLAAEDVNASAGNIAQCLIDLESKMASYRAAPEAASLPKSLLTDFTQAATALNQALHQARQYSQAYAMRQQHLAAWEAASMDSLKPDAIMREWQTFPVLPEPVLMAQLQSRLDGLLKRLGESRVVDRANAKQDAKELIKQMVQLLDKMEAALEEGALQLAAEQDKAMRALEPNIGVLPERQSARLLRIRAELKRLQGWARWGGHVSREELLHAAEVLVGQTLLASELAKKVGSLRERWKSLDASAGPSGKELWQRFDQACTAAYAPAAAHFKQQAEERKQSAEKALALINEIKNCAAKIASDQEQADWRAAAACIDRSKQAWHRLGSMDRKEKKRLDGEFDAAMQSLAAPLIQQRNEEIARRERLIAEAQGLDPKDRVAPEALRALQERWQRQAKALPLERKDEQALWQRFRLACDALFSARKEVSQALDADRRAHLQQKEALCVQLEGARDADEGAIRKLLRDAAGAWEKAGSVPNAAERQIESRYRKAVENLRKRLDEIKQKAWTSQYDALAARLKLCWAVEKKAADRSAEGLSSPDELASAWEAVPQTFKELQSDLQERFQACVRAIQTGASSYTSALEQNRTQLLRELLRLEIVCGVQSPAEFAQERLRLQVEVLQSALKSGLVAQDRQKGAEIFRVLVRLPAVADDETAARILRLIARSKA